jgi:hypothetical protein
VTNKSEREAGRIGDVTVWPADWSILREAHPNVLVTGTPPATGAFLRAVEAFLRPPVVCVDAGDPLPSAPTSGTLVLRGIGRLSWDQQQALMDWYDEAKPKGSLQVVTLTETPLYPQVQAGVFLDALYYRLGTLLFQVSS